MFLYNGRAPVINCRMSLRISGRAPAPAISRQMSLRLSTLNPPLREGRGRALRGFAALTPDYTVRPARPLPSGRVVSAGQSTPPTSLRRSGLRRWPLTSGRAASACRPVGTPHLTRPDRLKAALFQLSFALTLYSRSISAASGAPPIPHACIEPVKIKVAGKPYLELLALTLLSLSNFYFP